MTLLVVLDLLGALLFVFLTIILFLHFRRQPRPERLHVFIAFTFVSFGFLLFALDGIIFLFTGSVYQGVVVSKLFDISLMVAVLWFYVFLTDFIEELKRYITVSLAALLVVVGLVTYLPVQLVREGSITIDVRHPVAGLAIVGYWMSHFILSYYAFWKYSRYMEEKEIRARALLMTIGIGFGTLVYPADILLKLFFPHSLLVSTVVAYVFAFMAAISFFLGAEMPTWLKSLIV